MPDTPIEDMAAVLDKATASDPDTAASEPENPVAATGKTRGKGRGETSASQAKDPTERPRSMPEPEQKLAQPPPAAVDPDAPEPEITETDKHGAGYANPLGIPLCSCHLPIDMARSHGGLVKYALQNYNRSDVAGLSPSKNERACYQQYLRIKHRRPVSLRMFSAAMRGIVAGRQVAIATSPDLPPV